MVAIILTILITGIVWRQMACEEVWYCTVLLTICRNAVIRVPMYKLRTTIHSPAATPLICPDSAPPTGARGRSLHLGTVILGEIYLSFLKVTLLDTITIQAHHTDTKNPYFRNF